MTREEAISKIRAWDFLDNDEKEALETLIPELKESDDERIRKAIIKFLIDVNNGAYTKSELEIASWIAWLEKQGDKDKLIKELGEYKYKYTLEVLEKHINSMNNKDDERLRKTTIAFLKDFAEQGYENAVECIDWLEKQGEQKPADKVEPKFHEGEWVVCEVTGSVYKIENCAKNLRNHKYGYDLTNGGYIGSDEVNHYHLWTIQDAKEGDVLAAADWVFIFRKFHINGFPKCYCHYDLTLDEFKIDMDSYMASGGDIYPATKEQRELLFSKMKEAGYEWDDSKKELKKIEQKPAWGEEDSVRLQRIIDFLWYNRKGDIDTIYQQEQDIDWLKSLKQRMEE